MIKSFLKVLDLNNPELIIQKLNKEKCTLYRKWKNGLEETYTFIDPESSISKEISSDNSIIIKEYENSTGYKFSMKIDGDAISYEDNLGGRYIYNYITHNYESDDLVHKYDDNGNLIYYKSPDGSEESFEYDENNRINKYEKYINGENVITRTYQRYIADENSEERKVDEPFMIIREATPLLYSERSYDIKGREFVYEEKDIEGNRLVAITQYDDEGDGTGHTSVYKNYKLIYEYDTKKEDKYYGKLDRRKM